MKERIIQLIYNNNIGEIIYIFCQQHGKNLNDFKNKIEYIFSNLHLGTYPFNNVYELYNIALRDLMIQYNINTISANGKIIKYL